MEGTPADLRTYKDNNVNHDHTYYGNGCNNGWGTGGEGGSQTPCADSDAGGRYITTADSETQKNGTYYHYQAASVGTGGAMTADNSVTPDTFCPLGWQLPYGGTGGDYYDKSKSWRLLFTTYSINFNTGTHADAVIIKSYPFSNVYSGDFNWETGRLYGQTLDGIFWPSTIQSASGVYRMSTGWAGIRTDGLDSKNGGFTIRCVGIRETSLLLFRDAKISSICVICGPDATTWSASARSPVTTGATKRSAKTPNVGFLPQWAYRRISERMPSKYKNEPIRLLVFES